MNETRASYVVGLIIVVVFAVVFALLAIAGVVWVWKAVL